MSETHSNMAYMDANTGAWVNAFGETCRRDDSGTFSGYFISATSFGIHQDSTPPGQCT